MMFAQKTLAEVRRELTRVLREKTIDTPDLDARILLMDATGLSRAQLVAGGQDVILSETAQMLEINANRRISGEPIDSILGHAEFYGRRFKISKDVLSPRSETEGLVDTVLKALEPIKTPRILDLGTGSGAILLTLLAERGDARGIGADKSIAALSMAKQNAGALGVSGRAEWVESDWLSNIDGEFDVIVSNPPYITHAAMDELSIEVREYDPDMALRGGESGLDAYQAILAKAGGFLKTGGALIVEIGYDQGQSVSRLFAQAGYENVRLAQDLSGLDRIVSGYCPQK